MIKVYVSKQGSYPISAVSLKKFLREFFEAQGIVSDSFVSVALVNEKKMLALAKKYYHTGLSAQAGGKVHNVFSFVESKKTDWKNPERVGIDLGEIVVCYPVAVAEASIEGKLVEEKIFELVEHAGHHLLGRHHK